MDCGLFLVMSNFFGQYNNIDRATLIESLIAAYGFDLVDIIRLSYMREHAGFLPLRPFLTSFNSCVMRLEFLISSIFIED